MLKKLLFAGVAATLFAAPAYAHHCPKDAKAIDHALSVMQVSDEVKKNVTELKDKGMQSHQAGNHEEAEHSLAEAMRILLLEMK